MMSSREESNKALAHRYYREIVNEGDLRAIAELLSVDMLFTTGRGRSAFTQEIIGLRRACPDFRVAVELMLAEGDTVVGHWTGSGTHIGEALPTRMGEVRPTGKRFTIDGMTWLRIVDGKIVESLTNEDSLGLLLQLGALPNARQPVALSSPEENKQIVSRYFAGLLSEGNLNLIMELFAADCAFRIPTLPEPVRGQEGMRQFVTGLRTGFPDIRFTVERLLAEGDKVAARWTINGTHHGPFLGIPATGNAIRDQGTDIFRIVDRRIAEVWVNENDLGLMQQLGAIPARFPT
jgi:steroid delta-isomerase-like uncharacterized protein